MQSTGDTLNARFDPRANAIGFLRLAFASAVVFSHIWPAGGFGSDPGRDGMNAGILAVDGFFALSGFLITASAARVDNTGRFLWHRVLRIMPAFWVALVVIALVFATAASGQLQVDGGSFVGSNFLLVIQQHTIGATLDGNPFSPDWTGPMYTLGYEFFCYLVVAALAGLGLLRGRVLVGMLVLSWLWLLAAIHWTSGADYRQARFVVAFMVGAALWAFAKRVPSALWSGAVAAAVWLAALAFAPDYRTYVLLVLPVFAYLVIWAATVIPFRKVGVKRDLSYGVYLYGWPVQQLLVAWGAASLGLPLFMSLVATVTVSCAAASWYLVESRALKLKSRPLLQRPVQPSELVWRESDVPDGGVGDVSEELV